MTSGIAATGSRVAYFYAVEDATGAISATVPDFKPIRMTSVGLQETSNELKTNELRADRHIATARRGATTVAGDIVGELSYGTYDDLLEAAFCGTWTADVLVTGTTRRTFAILKRYLDIGLDTIYRGCEVNQLKLSCPLQEKITATFSMIGKSEEAYTVPAGAVFDAKTVTDYMTTFEGSLDIAAVGFNAATQLDITLDNQMAQKYSLFNRAAYASKIGMIAVSGSLSAYIEDDALKLKYRNEVDTALDVTVVDGTVAPNTYLLSLPRSRFTSATDSFSGDDLGIQAINFIGLLDATSGTELKLTRTPAA